MLKCVNEVSTMIDKEAIGNKIYKQARDLEVAIYNTLFLKDDPFMAVVALSLFQNKDGGFHGLEPDLTNPNSTPFQTSYALEVLIDLGYNSKNMDEFTQKMTDKTIKYLEKTMINDSWERTVDSNNDYPCAIWWKKREDEDIRFNPKASLVASILKLTGPRRAIYKKALIMKEQIIKDYLVSSITDKHDLICLARLYLQTKDQNTNKRFKEKLFKDVQNSIDFGNNEGYITTPLDYPLDVEHYGLSRDVLKQTVEYLNNTFKGSFWDINWTWMNQDEGFDTQSFKWHGIIAIRNLRFLESVHI